MYEITKYSYIKAKELGVKIKPSTHKGKKIDVYDANNNFITAIGDIRYNDYPNYVLERGKTYADNRKKLYNLRHAKDSKVIGSAGFFSKNLLW